MHIDFKPRIILSLRSEASGKENLKLQGGGHWAIYYTSPQRLHIRWFTTLVTFIEFQRFNH